MKNHVPELFENVLNQKARDDAFFFWAARQVIAETLIRSQVSESIHDSVFLKQIGDLGDELFIKTTSPKSD